MLKTIKLGDTGNIVKVAQYVIGYAEMGEADGAFSDAFSDHVCQWQEENGLSADGIIGSQTWASIAKQMPTCSTSKNKKTVFTCAIQILVGGIEVDGSYGPKTKSAVAAFQSAAGLVADGICGPKTWGALIGTAGTATTVIPTAGTGTGAETVVSGGKTLNNCVHYLQWDSRWENVKYSTHTSAQTIGNSGCGPSSMAMIMATFIDKAITPVEMCKLAVNNGYRTYDDGTDWGFYPFVFSHYEGFAKYIPTNSVSVLTAALAEGALAVCSMNSNDGRFWTSGG